MRILPHLCLALAILSMAAVEAAAQTAACPRNAAALAEGAKLTCQCPAGQDKPGAGPVSGDNRYTADSSICRAAIHAGKIKPEGGAVTVIVGGACSEFPPTDRNGVKTMKWGRYAKTFGFGDALPACPVTAAPPPPPPAPSPPSAQPRAPAPPVAPAAAACPSNMANARENAVGTKLTCLCAPASVEPGSGVYGSDRYTLDSRLCLAARHAGKIDDKGGTITVHVAVGCPVFEGTARNGVTSAWWRTAFAKTIAFADPPPACAAAPAATPAPAPRPATPAPSGPDAALQKRADSYAALLPAALPGWTAGQPRGTVEHLPGRPASVSAFAVYRPTAKAGTGAELTISIANQADGSPGYPIEQWNDAAKRAALKWEKKDHLGRPALVGPDGAYQSIRYLTKNNLWIGISWRQIEPAEVDAYIKKLDFAKIEALASK